MQERLLSLSRVSSQSAIGMPAYTGTLGDDDLYHFSLGSCPCPNPCPSFHLPEHEGGGSSPQGLATGTWTHDGHGRAHYYI